MKNLFALPAIGLIWIYKYTLSPVLSLIGVKCRHYPSCSSYAIEAMERYGFWGGGWMTLARLLRCHPVDWLGGTSGVDNVPKSITKPPLWAPWRYGLWRGTLTDTDHGDDHFS